MMRDEGSKPVPTINLFRLEQYYRAFVRFVEAQADGEPFASFNHPYLNNHENYKLALQHEARHQYLKDLTWRESDIGTGRIIDRTIAAIEKPEGNNLVQSRRWQNNPEARNYRSLIQSKTDAAKMQQYEQLLYQFYHDQVTDETAMAQFIKLAGKKYGFIAYLYFLKNPRRYAPIAPANFDTVFRKLGVDFITSHRCSWQNYQTFNELVRQVQGFLRDKLPNEDVNFIDAHSFLWILREKEVTASPETTASWTNFKPATPCTTNPIEKPQCASSTGEVNFDALQRERSRIGRLGEDFVIEYERNALKDHPDLAANIEQVEDHRRGFDVRSFEPDGTEKQIEVKTVSGKNATKTFFLTENERQKAATLDNYYLYFVTGINEAVPEIYYFHRPDYQNSDNFRLQVVNYQMTVSIIPTETS